MRTLGACGLVPSGVQISPSALANEGSRFKYKLGEKTKLILEILEKEPKTSTEIQSKFGDKVKPQVRARLTELYRHGHLVRSPFKTLYGYIYALPKDKGRIIDKLKDIVPPYVRHAVEMLTTQKKIFTLNHLVELTQGNFETMEYYLDNIFVRQLNWIKNTYHKSFKLYYNSTSTLEDLIPDFERNLSKIHEQIKVQGENFEKEVEKILDQYLFGLPIKVEKSSSGTPSGKYFDLSYKLYLFEQPVHVKVEIKSYIPNLYQVAQFYRKLREFKHGSIIPVVIAPAFPSVIYSTFGDVVYLVQFGKLKQFTEALTAKISK